MPILLPLVEKFHRAYPQILVDIRRTHSRHVAVEVLHRNLDFGLMTFHATERRLRDLPLGDDDMVVIVHPHHRFAKKVKVTFAEWAQERIIFHNDPSSARERAIRYARERKLTLNIRVAVPSLDGIKLAVEMGMGVSFLPRRSVINEVRRRQVVAVPMPELRLPRQVRLVYRGGPQLSPAARVFLETARAYARESSGPARRVNRVNR